MPKHKKAVTLVELVIASLILIIALTAFLSIFNNLIKGANYNHSMSLASSACRNKLEEMVNHNFTTLLADYNATGTPGNTFDFNVPSLGITGKGRIDIVDRSALVGGGGGGFSDGVHWVCATDYANWSARTYPASVVYPSTGPNSKMWVIGGSSGNDIWWCSGRLLSGWLRRLLGRWRRLDSYAAHGSQ